MGQDDLSFEQLTTEDQAAGRRVLGEMITARLVPAWVSFLPLGVREELYLEFPTAF